MKQELIADRSSHEEIFVPGSTRLRTEIFMRETQNWSQRSPQPSCCEATEVKQTNSPSSACWCSPPPSVRSERRRCTEKLPETPERNTTMKTEKEGRLSRTSEMFIGRRLYHLQRVQAKCHQVFLRPKKSFWDILHTDKTNKHRRSQNHKGRYLKKTLREMKCWEQDVESITHQN